MSLFHGSLKFNNFPICSPVSKNFEHEFKNCPNYWCPEGYGYVIWFSEVFMEVPQNRESAQVFTVALLHLRISSKVLPTVKFYVVRST